MERARKSSNFGAVTWLQIPPMKYDEITIPIADSSKSYRLYYCKHYYCTPCPECQGLLAQKFSMGMVTVSAEQYDFDITIFLTRYGYFCNSCPVVVVDLRILEGMTREIQKYPNCTISMTGLVNLNLIPNLKNTDLELEQVFERLDDDQKYLTPFLPPLNNRKAPRVVAIDLEKAFPIDFDLPSILETEQEPIPSKPPVLPPPQDQIQNFKTSKLPGRNENCLCGSGKKFKNCCYRHFFK
jgi:hypothetical protein